MSDKHSRIPDKMEAFESLLILALLASAIALAIYMPQALKWDEGISDETEQVEKP